MASPHVAAVAALVKSNNPSLSNTEIRDILESNTDDIGASGWDQQFGHGRLNAYKAVQAAGGTTPANNPPEAGFTYSTSDLLVSFTDTSTDSDGSIAAWNWDFGDSSTSTEQHPVHQYAADGTYTVTLTVTDNEDATDSAIQDITVTTGGTTSITLSETHHKSRGTMYVDLAWEGATGSQVNIYRDGQLIATVDNTGSYQDSPGKGGGTFVYQVCETDGSACSNEVTVIF
jgi:PKD repeat protein